MVTYRTKFFTVFLILLSIVFQISSFPDYRFFIEEGYAPIWPQPSDRQLKMIDRAEGLIIMQDFINRRFTKNNTRCVKNVQNLPVRVQVMCSADPNIIAQYFGAELVYSFWHYHWIKLFFFMFFYIKKWTFPFIVKYSFILWNSFRLC